MLTSVLPLALQAADRRHGHLVVVRGCGPAAPAGERARYDRCCQHAACVSSAHGNLAFSVASRWCKATSAGARVQRAPDFARNTAAAAARTTKYGDEGQSICFRAAAGVGF